MKRIVVLFSSNYDSSGKKIEDFKKKLYLFPNKFYYISIWTKKPIIGQGVVAKRKYNYT